MVELDPSGGRLRYFEDAHLNREAGQVRLSVTSEVVAATPELLLCTKHLQRLDCLMY